MFHPMCPIQPLPPSKLVLVLASLLTVACGRTNVGDYLEDQLDDTASERVGEYATDGSFDDTDAEASGESTTIADEGATDTAPEQADTSVDACTTSEGDLVVEGKRS